MTKAVTLVIYLLNGSQITTNLPSMDECLTRGFGIAQEYSVVRFDCIVHDYHFDPEA